MANLVAKNEQLLEQAKEERTIIIAEAREVAEKLKADIIEKAKVEAERKVQDALKEIDTQKKAAIVEVKNTVGALAIDIAGKIVRKELSGSEDHKSFVEKMIKESNLN
jgi:F-type H+-transporting ATPase subunit b